MDTRKILQVFLASPSDLVDERRTARAVVESVNRSVRSLGVQLELLGWEDTLPGVSRPQEAINVDVDRCDLFIGALSRRWGQETLKYSSGFEEEFDRALERSKQTGAPEIWLFFRELAEEDLQDPGAQLQKVLAFREERNNKKDVLYKLFVDEADWSTKVTEYLTRYVIELSEAGEVSQLIGELALAPAEPPAPAGNELDGGSADGDAAVDQARLVLANAAEELGSARNPDQIDETNLARLFMLAACWSSIRLTNELLPPHELNSAYRHRSAITLTAPEQWVVLRTIVAQEQTNKPGWYWHTDLEDQELAAALGRLALHDGRDDVRIGAITLLANISSSLSESVDFAALGKLLLAVASQPVRAAALSLLMRVRPSGAAEIVDVARRTPGLSEAEVDRALVLLQVDTDPSAAFRVASRLSRPLDPDLKSELRRVGDGIPTDVLRAGLADMASSARGLAVELLVNRVDVGCEELASLLTDAHFDVRHAAYEASLRLGCSMSLADLDRAFGARESDIPLFFDREMVREPLIEAMSDEELRALVDWGSVDGPLAYRLLAVREGISARAQLIEDLSSEFERLRSAFLEERMKEMPKEAAEQVVQRFDSAVGDFVRGNYREAGLRALAAIRDVQDRDELREALNAKSDKLRIDAIGYLAEVGTDEDARQLVALAISERGGVRDAAASAALQLMPGIDGEAAMTLLASGSPELVRRVLSGASIRSDSEFDRIVEPLLRSTNSKIREVGVGLLASLEQDELEERLGQYLDVESYYYNVVCWLDRVAYAPEPLRTAYAADLREASSIEP